VAEVLDGEDAAAVLASLEAGIAAKAERYRLLVSRVRGGHAAPDASADLDWLARALRVRAAGS